MFVRKWLLFAILGVVLITLAIQIFVFSSANRNDRDNDDRYFSMSRQNYKIFQPWIPDSLSFAGESVPLDHVIVRERLERELMANMYWHSHTILLLKRAGKFFPVIEPILTEKGVPSDLRFLAMCESELTNAVSPAGAAGFWQFLKKTGQEYGLEITSEIDERNHLEKSTAAACRYLSSAKGVFGSWTMAAASYNMGVGGLQQQVTAQKEKDYYKLLLNEETSRYVYRILALKLIYLHPLTYGFFIRNTDIYQPLEVKYETVTTDIPDLTAWAQQKGLSLLELKYVNPWLIGNRLTVLPGKSYQIALPITMKVSDYRSKIKNPYTIFNDSVTVE